MANPTQGACQHEHTCRTQAANSCLSWQQRCFVDAKGGHTWSYCCMPAACALPGSSCTWSPAAAEWKTPLPTCNNAWVPLIVHTAVYLYHGSGLALKPHMLMHTYIHKVMPAAACYSSNAFCCVCVCSSENCVTHVVSSGEKLPCSCLRRSW